AGAASAHGRVSSALFQGGRLLQRLCDRAQILPRHALVPGRAQEIGRVESGDRADDARAGVVLEPTPTSFHDALARLQQRLRGRVAKRDQHIRIYQFDLTLDEREADLGLLRRRSAVAGRTPRNYVGDVGARTVEPYRSNHAVQQLAGTADERQPLKVFLPAGSLADEHDARLRVTIGEYQPRGRCFQRAAIETFEKRRQCMERWIRT